jgi:transcriptional regulator with XRE-family HTH domain
MVGFGDYIRKAREALAETDPRFSLRQVAQRIEVEPAYLSKVERAQCRHHRKRPLSGWQRI